MNSLKSITIAQVGLLIISLTFFIISGSCKKEIKSDPIEYGTVTDIDGNVYVTVNIGDKWWMAENLKTTRYRNGDSIQFVNEVNFNFDSATWNHLDSGAYCIIDNSSPSSQNYQGKLFGLLYNGYAVKDSRNIAPVGWHVPSDEDWKQLEKFLGMSDVDLDKLNWRGTDEGNKMKINSGWNSPSDQYHTWGTNESGFSAMGGGCCMFNGVWGDPGTYSTGFWWSSTVNANNGQIWYRYLDYNKSNVFRFYGPMKYGFSIRCVKD
jgi:uncharacterized protein (TIGR02145 family)